MPLRNAAASSAFALLLLIVPAAAQNPNPGVLPPNSAPHGLTYGEWSAKWFKWAVEAPAAENPVLDTTGASCAVGQSDHVWFLATTFGPGSVVRSCTIPTGRMLFLLVGAGFCIAEPGWSQDLAGQRACATSYANGVSNFSVEIDGVPVKALNAPLSENYYRALSPAFDVVLPADNIFGAPAGTYSPGAADGVYLMLAPLSKGEHTIHIRADLEGQPSEATYHLTIGR